MRAERLLGAYVLPGRVTDPTAGIEEAIEAERIGLDSVWLSERFAVKEAGAICGALAYATERVEIAGTVYAHNRHPVTTASVASTLQALSKGRFRLVVARGSKRFFGPMGLPDSNFRFLADMIDIWRRLWRGETVDYDGPAGRYPAIRLVDRYPGPPPELVLTAMGPKTLTFAGGHFDAALLHPFLTADGVAKAAGLVRDGAAEAGRDPAKARVVATVIVAAELSPAEEDAIVGGRAVTYFQHASVGRMLCEMNGWDAKRLEDLWAHQTFAGLGKGETADQHFVREQLVEASRTLPREWLRDGAAVGSPAACADRIQRYFAAGADEVLLHGSSPRQMAAVVEAFRGLEAARGH